MLLTATLCLLAFGAVMVFSASSTTRILSNGGLSDSAFYLKRTLLFGAVGLGIMHLAARHGLETVRRLTPAILGISLFLLLAVLFGGTSVNGSSRWIGPSFIQLQPSELAKVALILYGADLLARKPKRARTLQGLMPFLLVVGAATLLIVAEPDLGTAMVVAFAVAATLHRRRHAHPRPRPDRRRPRLLCPLDDGGRALPDGAADRLSSTPAPTPGAPASRRRRRRSRSAPAGSSASASATACRRPSTCPRRTPT